MRFGKFRILGFQVWFPAFQDKRFERAFAVNQRGHNLAVARLRPVLQNHNITVENVPANHRIARHTQRERVPRRFEADAFHVHRNAALGVLLAGLGHTCRNCAEQRNVHDAASQLRQRGSDAQCSRLAAFGFDESLPF